jgi:hypothetical protein
LATSNAQLVCWQPRRRKGEALGPPLIPDQLHQSADTSKMVQEGLDADTFARCMAEGRSLTLDKAVSLALQPAPL